MQSSKPARIHVDKNGVICGAGAGAMAYTGSRGFLQHGRITNC
jgi:hypothetical protein